MSQAKEGMEEVVVEDRDQCKIDLSMSSESNCRTKWPLWVSMSSNGNWVVVMVEVVVVVVMVLFRLWDFRFEVWGLGFSFGVIDSISQG